MSPSSALITIAASGSVAEPETERSLVERARAGDHLAFERLIDARLSPTFRTVMGILGNEADARDVTQAIFLQAWRHLPSLRDPDLFPAWFGRIVANSARSAMRSRRRRSVREIEVGALDGVGDTIADSGPTQERRTEQLDRLERAFDRLAGAERTILWLHHQEGLSLAQIGSRLDIPVSTAKSRLFTARRALQLALAEEDR